MRTRALPRAATAILAAAAAGLLALPAGAADDDLDLASRATGGAPADGGSLHAAVSADGRLVAFESDAGNLSADDVNGPGGIFVRDLQAGTTTLASGTGASSGGTTPAISADGRFVAFESVSTGLVDADNDGVQDVFVRDLTLGTVLLVSRASGATGTGADGDSFAPDISADGRFVAFESNAANLAGDDGNGATDVFVRDIRDSVTTLVSRAPGGAVGDSASSSPSISADGRMVAFQSTADNLSTEDVDSAINIYVRDRQEGTTALADRAPGPGGAGSDTGAQSPDISADGRHVAFTSRGSNLSSEDAGAADVYVRDLQGGTTTLASRAAGLAGAVADADAFVGVLSDEGRRVAFYSQARNLSTGVAAAVVNNVFARDLQTGATVLVSRAKGPAGAGADGISILPAISGDGRFVVFESEADNLVADAGTAFRNVFRRELPGPSAPTVGPAAPGVIRGGRSTGLATPRCAGVRATIVGSAKRNVIRGTAKRDVIAALGGNDLVRGLGGDDLICLGAGNDRGIGGAGADRILGQIGADRVEGGLGRDLLEGGAGRDLLLGGAGIDRLLGLAGRDRAVGGAGNDVCRVELRSTC